MAGDCVRGLGWIANHRNGKGRQALDADGLGDRRADSARSGRAAGATTLRPAWENSMHFCRFSPSGEADSGLRPLPGPDGGPCF